MRAGEGGEALQAGSTCFGEGEWERLHGENVERVFLSFSRGCQIIFAGWKDLNREGRKCAKRFGEGRRPKNERRAACA